MTDLVCTSQAIDAAFVGLQKHQNREQRAMRIVPGRHVRSAERALMSGCANRWASMNAMNRSSVLCAVPRECAEGVTMGA